MQAGGRIAHGREQDRPDGDPFPPGRFAAPKRLITLKIAFPPMLPFWLESFWNVLPQLLTLLAASIALVMHMTTVHH
jgi:hypothetical protein